MRLLHAETLEIYEFHGSKILPYAILNTQHELVHVQNKIDFVKIQKCCQQAALNGLTYVWVDTCCIRNIALLTISYGTGRCCRWK
jgi:hypothetical protein